jgi:phosphoserine phosphatase
MVASFEGQWRAAPEEAPFLSLYGWTAIAFDDDDLRGVYVLGDPLVLDAHLATDGTEATEPETETEPAVWRRALAPLGRFLSRSDQTGEEDEAKTSPHPGLEPERPHPGPEPEPLHQTHLPLQPEAAMPASGSTPQPGLFKRFINRVNQTVRRAEAPPEEETATEDQETQAAELLFAYRPELLPLHTPDGLPQLPDELVPLCTLRYTERVRPEAIETIKMFSETGVSTKIFSSGAPDRTAALLRQAGQDIYDETSLRTISGFELAGMNSEQVTRAVLENTIFGHLSPEQGAQLVKTLGEGGQSVAVVGDGVNDVPAMRQANLAIAKHSSSQAALSAADILLLEDSPMVLQEILDRGQRIANGLMDVLKISLAQVFYLALLITALAIVLGIGFPYQSKQGSIINLLTVTIPSIGLSLWAAAGVLPGVKLRWLLIRFVAPATVTMGAVGLVVYWYFLERTGEIAYAQLTLTYAMVISGLLLVIFVRPPIRPRTGGIGIQSGDWRPTLLILILMIIFFLGAPLQLTQELFALDQLRGPSDYLVVGLGVLAWALTLRFVWLVIPVEPKWRLFGRLLDETPPGQSETDTT